MTETPADDLSDVSVTISGCAPAAVMSAMAAVSLVVAPWRGTRVALAGDIAFAVVVLAFAALVALGRRWPYREAAFWALALLGTALQVAVPLVSWGFAPLLVPPLLFVPIALLGLGVGIGIVLERARIAPPRRPLLLASVMILVAAGWFLVERDRCRGLRRTATNTSVKAIRAIADQHESGREPRTDPRDGWGWPIRIEQQPGGLLITAPGAGGRFETPRPRGSIASWEDDLVMGPNQTWHRWPPGGNNSGPEEPWRAWRSSRWDHAGAASRSPR
jgi:hypothetical protein